MIARRRGRAPRPALLLLALAACGPARDPRRAPRVHELDLPAAPGSGEVQLTAAPGGRVLASWLEPQGESAHALRFATLDGRGWSPPRTITAGDELFVNFADFPAVVALSDGTLWAHWLHERGPRGAYDVRLSASRDGGTTWSAPVSPHRDGTSAEHGFVSLLPWSDGRLALAWLDGRKWAALQGAGHGRGGETQLMHTLVSLDGTLGDEVVLDERVCDCCQTAAVATPRGVVVAYRDRGADEVRDIAVVRHEADRWAPPRVLAADGWRIAGCPVNGPALAARGEQVTAAWYTSARTPRVSVAFSSDAGAAFGAPVAVDDGRPLGRVDVVLLDSGDALVSWLEQTVRGAELRLRRVSPDGARGEPLRVADLSAARSSGFPRLERSGERIVIAWRDAAAPPRLHAALVDP